MNAPRLLLLAAILAPATAFGQGPLAPPAGAPVAGMKSLDQIATIASATQTTANSILAASEPRIPINATTTPGTSTAVYRITNRGSYYLTGNVNGVTAKYGIEIASNNVTVDLMGFTLLGIPGTLDGIHSQFNSGVIIRNGIVNAFGGDGIDLRNTNSFSYASLIENIISINHTGVGIITNESSIVRNCVASDNDGDGISVWASSLVEGCSSTRNTGNGITTTDGSIVSKCVATQNGGNGIVMNSGGIISECSVFKSTLDGIRTSFLVVIRDNNVQSSGFGGDGAGIHVTSFGNRIEGNVSYGADRGIDVDDANNFIIRNTCRGNAINWDMVANNNYGVILNRSSAVTAAVSGNSAASALGTTEPDANFSY